MSAIQALNTPFSDNKIINNVLYEIRYSGGHFGIKLVNARDDILDNKLADKAAKAASQFSQKIINTRLLYLRSTLKSLVKQEIIKRWQFDWDNGVMGRQKHFFLSPSYN